MAKSLTKKELRAPDQFQSLGTQAVHWIEDHIKVIIAVAAAIVLLSFIWIGYGYYQGYKESGAEKTVFPAQAQALKTIESATGTEGINIGDFIKVLESNKGTKASLSGAMHVIGALNLKENTESLQKQVLSAADTSLSESHLLFGLWNLTKGDVLMRNGENASAKESYQSVLSASGQKEFHPSALIKLGALAEKEGDLDGARAFYRRVTVEFPDSAAKKVADRLLIHLDLLDDGAGNT